MQQPAFADSNINTAHLSQSQNITLDLQGSGLMWLLADNFSWGFSDDELIRQTLQGQGTPSPLLLLDLESDMIETEGLNQHVHFSYSSTLHNQLLLSDTFPAGQRLHASVVAAALQADVVWTPVFLPFHSARANQLACS